jgi:hypothetical protein
MLQRSSILLSFLLKKLLGCFRGLPVTQIAVRDQRRRHGSPEKPAIKDGEAMHGCRSCVR